MKNIKHLIICLLLIYSSQALAQETKIHAGNPVAAAEDTIKQYLDDLKQKNITTSANNNIVIRQNKILKRIKEKSDIGRALLQQGFDSIAINWELRGIQDWNEIASKGVFETDAKFILKANLNVSSIIFRELLTRTEKIQNKLLLYRTELENVQSEIDSLVIIEALYQIPSDTIEARAYLLKASMFVEEAIGITDQTKNVLNKIQKQELLTSVLKFDLEDKLLKSESIQVEQLETDDLKDFENFTTFLGTQKSIQDIINFSGTKVLLATGFYLLNHLGLMFLMILFLLAMTFYIKTLKKHLTSKVSENSVVEYYALKYPFYTSFVVITVVFQYLFGNPPFSFYAGLWGISFILLIFITRKNFDKVWHRWFLGLGVLYFTAYYDNMILLQHTADKFFVLILAVLSIVMGVLGLIKIKKSDRKLNFIKGFLIFFLVMEFLSLFLNLFDYYSASKRAAIAGILGVVLIILIRTTLEILYRMFNLSLEVYKKSDDSNFIINLERFNSPTPKYYTIVGFVGWLYMFVHFFYILQIIVQPVKNFFSEERSIGNFVFTFEGIALFVSIIFISTALSKVLSYLLADSYIIKERTRGKKGIELGSWILLLRIGIISLGLLIAFASAGIALDRITIIISALSVGIGFGMQTLINNLVSGIIIAFEKPISVGDVIEVAGKTGRMKSIGIRSSMVTTWDGSDVVIPNGDLLNQHLTNWTLGNSNARFEIIVGVAYGTNLEYVHRLIIDLLHFNDEILKYPQPLVVFREFGNSSIDMSIKFWVGDYTKGIIVKSELIIAIDMLFKEKNIVIPFPQQDVYVKSLPGKDENLKT